MIHILTKNQTRFEQRTINEILDGASNKFWCPLGCGSIQIHALGNDQPVVVCQQCQGLFCYRHGVEWHFEHTCAEYEESLRDHTFRSAAQLRRDAEDVLEGQSRQLARQIATADDEWRRGLVRKGDEARLRQMERERLRREQLERQAALRAEQRRREEQAEAQRKADRKAEEKQGKKKAKAVSTICPNCKEGVQRSYGW